LFGFGLIMADKISRTDTQLSESVSKTDHQAIVGDSPDQISIKTPENKSLPADYQKKTETFAFSETARSFCEFTHEYLRQYIELADQKAAFLFAITSAVSGYIITSKVSPFVNSIDWQLPLNWSLMAGKASVLLFLISALSCILAVLPRLKRNERPGLIFWEEIIAVDSADKYVKMVGNHNDQSMSYEIAAHSHTLAGICNRKYLCLKVGMYVAFAGFLLFAYYLWPILPTIAGVATQ